MERFAKSLAVKMYENQLIAFESIDNYSYAVEMGVIRIIGWVVLLSIAALAGWFFEICCYLLFFSAIRMYGGGIHFNSFFGCLLISVFSTIIPVILFQFEIPFIIYQGVIVLAMIFAVWIGSVNNEFISWTTEEYRKAKSINRLLVSIEVIIILISSIVHISDKYIFFMMYGLISASFSMFIDYLHQKGGEIHEEP